MKKVTKEIFISSDGKEFTSEEECRTYELENQEKIIEKTVYLFAGKWGIYEQLINDGIVFDEENEKLQGMLKYILNEVSIKIRLNKETGEYSILEIDGKKVLENKK
ncbi:hypothetical protein DLH72_01275 [Candidatus Gracilibacteria bacterium]|nr:MAG: hypothetical protein DLH72_01275 [Candidatus Gracilibacteria bacterium]